MNANQIASKEYEIPKDWIIVITEPLKEIVNNYKAIFVPKRFHFLTKRQIAF